VAAGKEVRMSDKIDVEAALRTSLIEHARQAPPADGLAERIIADVDRVPPARERLRSRQWRTWTLPLVAAGSVAAVAAALVGVNTFHHDASHKPAGPISSVPGPTPAVTTTPTQASRATTSTSATAPPTSTVPGLTGVHVVDVTFVGTQDGWALARANCLNGSGPACIAMIRTSDGGSTWTSTKPPPANIPVDGCSDPCVSSIRFATAQIGYAFGPGALFMTLDGGASWHHESGGAYALETLDGNVIRVVASPPCSPPGCHYAVQTAAVGTDTWTTVALPGAQPNMSAGAALARAGNRAFIEIFGHTAGGASNARSVLYTSGDDGASWTNRGEPCPQVGGTRSAEVDSSALASAADGSATLLCTGRGDEMPQFTMTSTDGGATFHQGDVQSLRGANPVSALGAASASTLIGLSVGTYRSTDGGRTWRKVGGTAPAGATWIGFESATEGRATDGRTIWTTQDAGLTWTSYTFH
jgi:hypothetical protein